MKTLSEDTFKALAGDSTYERGLDYYNQGRVGALTIKNNRINAEVEGTHSYKVELQHTKKLFEGSCNCPASDNFDFCKHCVAASLAYYYQTQTNQELAESAQDDLLHGYISTLTKPQLVEALHSQVQGDSDALDYWYLKAEIASGNMGAPEVRKRITKAIPYKPSGLWRYRDVAEYFEQSEQAMSVLQEPLMSLQPSNAIKLIVYASQRLQKTLESIDDTGDYRSDLETLLIKMFESVFSSDEWSLKEKTETILDLLFDQQYSYDLLNLPHGVAKYFDDKALDSIYKKIEEEWNKLSPENEAYSPGHYRYQRLEDLLLERARSQGNLNQELKILERGAVDVNRCLAVVELCIANQQLKDAEKWLVYTSQISQPDVRELYQIETVQIDLYKAQKKYRQALNIQWARFEEQESLEQFNAALETAKKIQQKEHFLSKGIASIKNKLVKNDTSQKNRQRAELLASIYLNNGYVNDAANMSNHYLLRPQTLMNIVNALTEINAKTFRLIEKATNRLLYKENKHLYDEAIKFLKQQMKRLNNDHAQEFQALVLRIYNEPSNKRKINFISRLKSAFPEYF